MIEMVKINFKFLFYRHFSGVRWSLTHPPPPPVLGRHTCFRWTFFWVGPSSSSWEIYPRSCGRLSGSWPKKLVPTLSIVSRTLSFVFKESRTGIDYSWFYVSQPMATKLVQLSILLNPSRLRQLSRHGVLEFPTFELEREIWWWEHTQL